MTSSAGTCVDLKALMVLMQFRGVGRKLALTAARRIQGMIAGSFPYRKLLRLQADWIALASALIEILRCDRSVF
jgi:hypothetical protein